MTCAGVKVVYQCLNVEYMYMWYREIECACRKVDHTAHRFNHEAVGWIVHIELGVCVCVYVFVDCGPLCSASSLSVDFQTFVICQKCMAGMTVDHMGVGYILTPLQKGEEKRGESN